MFWHHDAPDEEWDPAYDDRPPSGWKASHVYAMTGRDLAAFYRSCRHRGLRGWWHRRVLRAHTPFHVAYGNETEREG